MTSAQALSGTILTPTGWVHGSIEFDSRIIAIRGGPIRAPGAEPVILPGFVDLHVHGGDGADFMDGGDGADTAARLHARHGTTSLLATTVTAPRAELERALGELGPRLRQRAPGAARVLGVHLEGPFVNPDKLGAQPAHARTGTLEEVQALDSLARVRVVTLAPELPGALELVRALARAGVTVQLGHTLATYDQAVEALRAGARGFTHLFNAMTGVEHRSPGAVAAALALGEHAEIIPDLVHVHPGAMLAAMRAVPKLHCVTDACLAAGMPDGELTVFGQAAVKHAGAVRIHGATLAGSVLTMDQALRNLVSIGLPLAEAAKRVSTHAADYLGLFDRGRLTAGSWADLAVLGPTLELEAVFAEGERIEP
jgi:N-acetylglucosamine-6-phosphate deacetylase